MIHGTLAARRRHACAHRGRRGARDAGSFAVEFAAGFGIVITAILVMAVAYQTSQSGAAVTNAAREAARTASLATSADGARRAADGLVRTRFADTDVCAELTVETTTAQFRAAGTVQVTVTCRTNSLLGWQRTLRATGEAVIDRYRGGVP
ncbi:TadE/TadG family type IV pilus assembly protein [Parafrankia sp. EUN1f]|uniref:TadE/TadG family type IV pilus assembly protein n=1 Tax=Parafrankia sp. EUN1f TaxID=102897 RepID=UPI0001C45FE9|nr:hypothetical protein [Parafrankia sp. EUN1f]EFC81317.1 hypothetical protein FrEUN1fDRAFT_5564 [Parafrankia sp. EUN1f]